MAEFFMVNKTACRPTCLYLITAEFSCRLRQLCLEKRICIVTWTDFMITMMFGTSSLLVECSLLSW